MPKRSATVRFAGGPSWEHCIEHRTASAFLRHPRSYVASSDELESTINTNEISMPQRSCSISVPASHPSERSCSISVPASHPSVFVCICVSVGVLCNGRDGKVHTGPIYISEFAGDVQTGNRIRFVACVRARRSCVRFCWLVFQGGNGRARPWPCRAPP